MISEFKIVESDFLVEGYISVSHTNKKLMLQMIRNVMEHPFSDLFKDELHFFLGCRMTSHICFDKMDLKNADLGDHLMKEVCEITDIKGVIITYSEDDSNAMHLLNNEIDSFPEHIICISYGGVKLTNNKNCVEIFVFSKGIHS